MTRSALTLIAILAAASAFSQTPGKKPTAPKITCPVMKGSPVNVANATKSKLFADYKGRRYFFCCGACPGPFKKDPAKWSKGTPSLPTPKAAKKPKKP